MIIRYQVQRHYENEPNSGLVVIGINKKVISKKELPQAIKDGWTVVRKEYFIITYCLDFFRRGSINDISKMIGIILAIITLIFQLIHLISA